MFRDARSTPRLTARAVAGPGEVLDPDLVPRALQSRAALVLHRKVTALQS